VKRQRHGAPADVARGEAAEAIDWGYGSLGIAMRAASGCAVSLAAEIVTEAVTL